MHDIEYILCNHGSLIPSAHQRRSMVLFLLEAQSYNSVDSIQSSAMVATSQALFLLTPNTYRLMIDRMESTLEMDLIEVR